MLDMVDRLRRINHYVAIGAGLLLLACVALTILEIIIRRIGYSLGGIDEISGYVMAFVTSWGISYALSELAHVRIDLVRAKVRSFNRALLDIVAILSLAGTALVVAYRGWSVLAKTLASGSRANTPLETPLWIPQLAWWSGWLWFAISACLIALAALVCLLRRDYDGIDEIAGAGSET